MDEIVINGTRYGSAEEMTTEHREIFLQGVKLLSMQGREQLPDVLEIYGNPDGTEMHVEVRSTSEEVRVSGERVEGDLESLPPDMRAAANRVKADGGNDRSDPDAGRGSSPGPGFDAVEVEARLRSSRDDSTLPEVTRSVRVMVGVLLGVVASLILLALLL